MSTETEAPLISVCIANYNGETIITECIDSVLAQKDAAPFEIIVHDDASTDGSLSVLEKYDSIRVIESSQNVGFCISNNRMAAAARGRFILLLNNDARLFDDALETLLEESRRHADRALLGLPQYDAATKHLVDRGLRLDYFGSSVPIMQPSANEVAMVIGACMWVPAELWNSIGGFPDWFETNAEDVYLCCYARLLGFRIYVPDKSGFLHMIGHSLGGGKSSGHRLKISVRRRYFSERNRLFVQWLFYPFWLFPITTTVNLGALTLEAILLAIVNRKLSIVYDIYIKSQLDAFSRIGHVFRVRRAVMQSREVPFSAFFRTFTFLPQKVRLLFTTGLPRADNSR